MPTARNFAAAISRASGTISRGTTSVLIISNAHRFWGRVRAPYRFSAREFNFFSSNVPCSIPDYEGGSASAVCRPAAISFAARRRPTSSERQEPAKIKRLRFARPGPEKPATAMLEHGRWLNISLHQIYCSGILSFFCCPTRFSMPLAILSA